MQSRPSKILDGYYLIIIYPEDKEYEKLEPLFKIYGLALTNINSNVVVVDGKSFDDNDYDVDDLTAIDGHEMAHIILGHRNQNATSVQELEADYFAVLMLQSIDENEAADLLIDSFNERHGVYFENAKDIIDAKQFNVINNFIKKYYSNSTLPDETDELIREFFTGIANKNLNNGKQRLIEGRVDDALKISTENNISKEVFDYLVDQSYNIHMNHKYLLWMLNQVIKNNLVSENEIKTNIIEPVAYFHKNNNNFTKRDIYSYQDLYELKKSIDEDKNKTRRSISEINPGEKIYEDDNVQIFCPETREASCKYGSGTKWCVSSESMASYYHDYKKSGELYYAISKTKTSDDSTYKLAIRFRFKKNETGYDIQEIRDAVNDRILSFDEFIRGVGEDGYTAIIKDLNERRVSDIEQNSYLKQLSLYESNPKAFLLKSDFNTILDILYSNGVVKNLDGVFDLLLSHDINPFTKPDLKSSDYFTYLLDTLELDRVQVVIKFFNEYWEHVPATYDSPIDKYIVFLTPNITINDIISYFYTVDPENWGRDLGIAFLTLGRGYYDTIPEKASPSRYFASDTDFHHFWAEWHGIEGFVSYCEKFYNGYFLKLLTYNSRYDELVPMVKSALTNGLTILDFYDTFKKYEDEYGFSTVQLITPTNWIGYFNQLYGENGINELVNFLNEKNFNIFLFLDTDSLLKYYGTVNEVIKNAIEYYNNDGDITKPELFEFLSDLGLNNVLQYFVSESEENGGDPVENMILFYSDEFFDYNSFSELIEFVDADKVFSYFEKLGLGGVLSDNVNSLVMFMYYYDKMGDKNLTSEQQLEYKRNAFQLGPHNDVRLNSDGTVDIISSGFEEFVDWFDDRRGYHSSSRDYARAVLGEDDNWEPYYDIVQNFIDEVWYDTNEKSIKYIKEHIIEEILPVEIDPDDYNINLDGIVDESYDGSDLELTPEIINGLSEHDLGDIIDTCDDFRNLRHDLISAYERAYNDQLQSETYNRFTNAILEYVNSKKSSRENNGRFKTYKTMLNGEVVEQKYELESLVIYDIDYFGMINEWCSYNVKYDADFEYSSFINFITNSELYPIDVEPDDYPRGSLTEYYNESIGDFF